MTLRWMETLSSFHRYGGKRIQGFPMGEGLKSNMEDEEGELELEGEDSVLEPAW